MVLDGRCKQTEGTEGSNGTSSGSGGLCSIIFLGIVRNCGQGFLFFGFKNGLPYNLTGEA